MKAKKLKGILAAMASTLLFSCSSSDGNEVSPSPSPTPAQETTIPVSIGFNGEVLNLSELPLSRTDNNENSKDWYYFQVYSKPESDQNDNYSPYAYGFFDNTEDMTINLKPGYKYKFDVGMCVKAEGKVEEFLLGNTIKPVSIGNTFSVSNEIVTFMYYGYLHLVDGMYSRPDIDRFFGEVKDYTPKEGGSVEINMKRVSFGVKFVAKNFDNGSLEIKMEDAPTINLEASEGSSVEKIISFDEVYEAYKHATNANLADTEYSENIPVNIAWIKSDGTRVPLVSQKVDFKRNKLTVAEFEVKDNTIDSGIDITANETMGEEEKVNLDSDGTNTGN